MWKKRIRPAVSGTRGGGQAWSDVMEDEKSGTLGGVGWTPILLLFLLGFFQAGFEGVSFWVWNSLDMNAGAVPFWWKTPKVWESKI